MGRIRFSADSHDIRFYIKSDENTGSFHDGNYLFQKLDKNQEDLTTLNNYFYLAIPIVEHEIDLYGEKVWTPDFLGDNVCVAYHILMKYSSWNSFVYQLKVPAPTSSSSESILRDTDPDSTSYDHLFLLVKLIDLCGSLRDLIEYQFSAYATYQGEDDGILYSTVDMEEDNDKYSYSNLVAVNNPTRPYIYDCPTISGYLELSLKLSRSVSFASPGESIYEILCFTDKITPSEQAIRNETRELMGDIRTFSSLDENASEYKEFILLSEGKPASTTTKYIDKVVLRNKGVKSVYLGVRLKSDNYSNHTEPNYNTTASMDWFRVDLDVSEKVSVNISSFSCNFMSLLDSDTVPGKKAIKAGKDNLLTINVGGTFPSSCKFYLDLGLFSKKIQIPYNPSTGFQGVNLIEYDKYFVPKISTDEYAITYEGLTDPDTAYGLRERAMLVVVHDKVAYRWNVINSVYSGVGNFAEIYRFARKITNIYDYDVLKDKSLYMNTTEKPECIAMYVTKYASSGSSGTGHIMIKNPFYFYKQTPLEIGDGSKGNSPYVEYPNSNTIIQNEEYYARIIYDCRIDVKHNGSLVIYNGVLQRNDRDSSLYGGFMLTSNAVNFALGENNFQVTIKHNDNILVENIPFLYVGVQHSAIDELWGEHYVESIPLSVYPGVGVVVNGSYSRIQDNDGFAESSIAFHLNGDLIVNGTIYRYNEEQYFANGINVTLPWPGEAWYYGDVGSEIIYIDSDIYNVELADYLLADIRNTGGHGQNNIYVRDCKIYVEEATAASPAAGGRVTCVMIDLTYTDPQSILWRYVGRYKNDTGGTLERYPLLNVRMSAVPRG